MHTCIHTQPCSYIHRLTYTHSQAVDSINYEIFLALNAYSHKTPLKSTSGDVYTDTNKPK